MRCTPTSRILDEVLGLVTSDKIPFNLSQFSDSKTPIAGSCFIRLPWSLTIGCDAFVSKNFHAVEWSGFSCPEAPTKTTKHCTVLIRWNDHSEGQVTSFKRQFIHGGFLKWWHPQNTPNWSFLVGKPMVVGYHHFRKPPHGIWNLHTYRLESCNSEWISGWESRISEMMFRVTSISGGWFKAANCW